VEEFQCQLYHHTCLSPICKWTLLKHICGFTNCNVDTQNSLTKGAPRVFMFHMRHNSSATCWSRLLMSLWRTPKSLVSLQIGLTYLNNGIVRNSGHAPALSTRRGRGACWSSGMGVGRVTSFTYLLEPASNQPTSWLNHFLEHPWY